MIEEFDLEHGVAAPRCRVGLPISEYPLPMQSGYLMGVPDGYIGDAAVG
jgi:hypothetical protein